MSDAISAAGADGNLSFVNGGDGIDGTAVENGTCPLAWPEKH